MPATAAARAARLTQTAAARVRRGVEDVQAAASRARAAAAAAVHAAGPGERAEALGAFLELDRRLAAVERALGA